MRIDVVNCRTSEPQMYDITEIEPFRLHVVASDDRWKVQINDELRAEELYDTQDEAVREMNGLMRARLRYMEEKRNAAATAPIVEPEEDDEGGTVTFSSLD